MGVEVGVGGEGVCVSVFVREREKSVRVGVKMRIAADDTHRQGGKRGLRCQAGGGEEGGGRDGRENTVVPGQVERTREHPDRDHGSRHAVQCSCHERGPLREHREPPGTDPERTVVDERQHRAPDAHGDPVARWLRPRTMSSILQAAAAAEGKQVGDERVSMRVT